MLFQMTFYFSPSAMEILKCSLSKNILFYAFLIFVSWNAGAAVQEHSGNLSVSEIWIASDVHRVTSDLTVEAGVVLTLEAGTIIKIDPGVNITIHGDLVASGTFESYIIITSVKDDSFGGDTDGDPANNPAPGDWGSLYFSSTANAADTSILSYIKILYGGAYGPLVDLEVDVSNNNWEVQFSLNSGVRAACSCSQRINATVLNCSGPGLLWEADEGSILGSQYSFNETGILVVSGSPRIRNYLLVEGNEENGIHVMDATPSIEEVEVRNNGDYGIFFEHAVEVQASYGFMIAGGNRRPARVPFSAMTALVLDGNQEDVFEIIGNHRENSLASWELEPYTYYVVEGTAIIDPSASIEIPAGSLFKMAPGTGLEVEGTLVANGLATNPIVFTSARDDATGFDLNAFDPPPANGDWLGIEFKSNAPDNQSSLQHVAIRYGGGSGQGGLHIDQTEITLANASFSNSGSYGLTVIGTDLIIDTISAFANAEGGIYGSLAGNLQVSNSQIYGNFGDGIRAGDSVSLSISQSSFFNNGGSGVNNQSSNQAQAGGNWWGDPAGPASGDGVNGVVDTSAFLTYGYKYHFFDAGGSASASYQLGTPVVSGGTPSTEWGSTAWESMLFNDTNKVITLDYSGLSVTTDGGYSLQITYLNRDPGSSIQRLEANGVVIHDDMLLPATDPVTYVFTVPETAINGSGVLPLSFSASSGTRAVVASVLLLSDTVSAVLNPPNPPTVTNYPYITDPGDTSGTIVATTSITLNGDRDDDTSVWLDGSVWITLGSGTWSQSLILNEGDNQLKLTSRIASGLESDPIYVNFTVDTIAPVVQGFLPADGAYTNQAIISILYLDAGQLDVAATSIQVTRDGQSVAGSWADSGTLHFTPDQAFTDGDYSVSGTIQDLAGNQSALVSFGFTLDQTPPAVPSLDPFDSRTAQSQITISGTREAFASVSANGSEIVASGATTTWSHVFTLVPGDNTFNLIQTDRAGNESSTAALAAHYDNVAPGPVVVLANGDGDGVSVALDWTAYDEVANGGDIQAYRVFQHNTDFTDTALAQLVDTVAAMGKSVVVNGLVRNSDYYFAVAAVDDLGNLSTSVTATMVTTNDAQAPEPISGLIATPGTVAITLDWTASVNSDGDLAGYRLYRDSVAQTPDLGPSHINSEITGLSMGTDYLFAITSIDGDGNESNPGTLDTATLLPNPTGLTADSGASQVTLSWQAVQASSTVSGYRIYKSLTDFSAVDGLTPTLSTSGLSAAITGLENGTTYYFAVTAYNRFNLELGTVQTTTAVPVADDQPPVISGINWDGSPLSNGQILERAGLLQVHAIDDTAMASVRIDLDGTQIGLITAAGANYSFNFDPFAYADGPHTLTVTALDSYDNSAVENRSIAITLAAPPAPTLVQPAGGTLFNNSLQFATGSADRNSQVTLYLNNVAQEPVVSVSSSGQYSIPVTLVEGANVLETTASNRGGESPRSPARTVTLDSSIPSSPTALAAIARENGVNHLEWRNRAESVSGYKIYRAASAFQTSGEATLVNPSLYTDTVFEDLTPIDGEWFYRVSAVNGAGTESELSEIVSSTSDRQKPSVLSVTYQPLGNTAGNRIAPGMVNLELELSEPLLTDPFFSISSSTGIPIPVQLSKQGETSYSGTFEITESTATGAAIAVFSGRDLVGNRGTVIDSGGSLLFDTKAPHVNGLSVTPQTPIYNDDGVAVQAIFDLDEALLTGTEPQLGYRLSISQPETQWLTVTEVTPTRWQVDFQLATQAGATPESLIFDYLGNDDLGNSSDRITVTNFFEVYRDGLPPNATPTGLSVSPRPNGEVALQWGDVPDTPAYQLYRQGPGEPVLTELIRVPGQTSYVDQPSLDGSYNYAVASIRQANGQEAISPMSLPVSVTADSAAPDTPVNLVLQLAGNGIFAQWEAAPGLVEAVTYNLYRADSLEITDVGGLEPEITGIPQTSVVDPYPSQQEHAYVVTAVDAAGNESLPSNSFYLNFELLPVVSLSITREGEQPPQISWTHAASNIAGYYVYRGPEANGNLLSNGLLAETSFSDFDYQSGSRTYCLVAEDDQGVASLGRSLLMPDVSFQLEEGSILHRGTMNQLQIRVVNQGQVHLNGVRVQFAVNEKNHESAAFSLEPGQTSVIPVIVGGYSDLADEEDGRISLIYEPNAGERVTFHLDQTVSVQADLIAIEARVEDFIRGGSGKARFALHNTSPVVLEVLTASQNGSQPSGEIRFELQDAEGNVVTTASFKQALGSDVVTLPSGKTVARIPAGQSFVSEPVTLAVPADAPETLFARVLVDQIHYNLDSQNHVAIPGVQNRREISLKETSYTAEVTAVTPAFSRGDVPIQITGRALERANVQPLGLVPVKLIIANRGFQRTETLYVGEDGTFSFNFQPNPQDGGLFEVKASHPQLLDTPIGGQFTISRLQLKPDVLNLRMPRNYSHDFSAKVKALSGTAVNNLTFAWRAEDQPGGQLQEGLLFDFPILTELGSGSEQLMKIGFAADNLAAETGTFVLRLISDESDQWATLRVNYVLSGMEPSLHAQPNFIETGVASNDAITETVILENRGLATMEQVTLQLVDTVGQPAPGWVVLNAPRDPVDLAVGETLEVGITFAPDGTVSTSGSQPYQFDLKINAANAPESVINAFCFVDQTGMGDVLFKVSDLYTGTTDENGQVIQGLANAKIRLIKEEGSLFETTLTTDELGEAFFQDLPVGRYRTRITASKRDTWQGRIWVKPGVTSSERAHLDADLITVEWEVVPTTLQDVYDIVLNATFETDIPAAVVVAEPSSVTLPAMVPGDTYQGEFFLTNYGLVRADGLKAKARPSTHYKIELLFDPPESLEAREVVRIPYRVTMLRSLVSSSTKSKNGGGVCGTGSASIGIEYEYDCANGETSAGSTLHTAGRAEGFCGAGGSVSSNSVSSSGSGPGAPFSFSGRDSGGGAAPKKCKPKCRKRDKCCKSCSSSETGSAVGLLTGDYQDDMLDFAVKVMGFELEVRRYYEEGKWYVGDHDFHRINFSFDSQGGVLEMELMDAVFQKTTGSYFTNGEGDQIKDEGGFFRWQNREGDWERYDATGRLISYGNLNEVSIDLLYDAGGRLVTIQDHFDNSVITFQYNGQDQVSLVQDYMGRSVAYIYDAAGNLVRVTGVLGEDMVYEYDSENRLTRKLWPNGKERNISRDQYGRIASVTNADGNGKFFEYSENRSTKEIYILERTSGGQITEYWFDKTGDLSKRSINGVSTLAIASDAPKEEFNEWGEVTRLTHADGSFETYEYDSAYGLLKKESDALGTIQSIEYDSMGNAVRLEEAPGSPVAITTHITYDNYGNPLTRTVKGDTPAEDIVERFEYDNFGNVTKYTDPEGNETIVSYDYLGNVLTQTDPNGALWTFAYDPMGNLTSSTDPLGRTETRAYDTSGKLISQVDKDGRTTLFQYDSEERLVRTEDSFGVVTSREFDLDGRVVREIKGDGTTHDFQYTPSGLISTLTLNNNHVQSRGYNIDNQLTHFTSLSGEPAQFTYVIKGLLTKAVHTRYTEEFDYDERGREVGTTITADGRELVNLTEYDARGRQIGITDADGQEYVIEYDALDRVIRETNPLGETVEYDYDNRNNLVGYRDGRDSLTTFEYDDNNNLTKQTDGAGGTQSFTYDESNNLVDRINSDNSKIHYTRNLQGLITKKEVFANKTDNTPLSETTFGYDNLGRLTSYDTGTIQASFKYLDAQQRSEVNIDYGSFTKTFAYEFDKGGRKTAIIMPSGVAYRYSYNTRGQLAAIQLPQGDITYDTYDYGFNAKKLTFPNGMTLEYGYDDARQLNSIYYKSMSGNVLFSDDLTRNLHGNITDRVTDQGSYSYSFDAIGQITSVTRPDGMVESYAYDSSGNRLSDHDHTYTYDIRNRIATLDQQPVLHDADGNLTQISLDGVTLQYSYDHEHQLIAVHGDNGLIVTYDYDPFGNLLQKTVNGQSTFFLSSEEGLIAEFDASGNEIVTYGYQPATSVSEAYPLFVIEDDAIFFLLSNHNLTPQKAIAMDNSLVWSASYAAFGLILGSTGTLTQNLGFRGQYSDSSSKLTFAAGSVYSSAVGRNVNPVVQKLDGGLGSILVAGNNPMNTSSYATLPSLTGSGQGRGKLLKTGDVSGLLDLLSGYSEASAKNDPISASLGSGGSQSTSLFGSSGRARNPPVKIVGKNKTKNPKGASASFKCSEKMEQSEIPEEVYKRAWKTARDCCKKWFSGLCRTGAVTQICAVHCFSLCNAHCASPNIPDDEGCARDCHKRAQACRKAGCKLKF